MSFCVMLHYNLTYFNICLCTVLGDLVSLSPAPSSLFPIGLNGELVNI